MSIPGVPEPRWVAVERRPWAEAIWPGAAFSPDTPLPPAVRAAYDAPFPSSAYMAGARIFPALVPVEPANVAVPANLRAWDVLGKWQKPVLTLFGKNDPILGHADAPLQRHIPGCQGQPHERFWGGHFVQENRGDYLAQKLIAWAG